MSGNGLAKHLAMNDPLYELDVYDCPIRSCRQKAIGLSHLSRHIILEHQGHDGSMIDRVDDLVGTPYAEMDAKQPSWREHIARHLHVQLIAGDWDAAAVLEKLQQEPAMSPLLEGRICRDCALAFEKGDTSKRDKATQQLNLISRPRKRASVITFLVADKLSILHGKRSEHRTSAKTQAGHLDLEVASAQQGEHVKFITRELELSGQPTLREFLQAEAAATKAVVEAEGDNLKDRVIRRRFGFEPNGLNGQMSGIYLPYKLNRTGEGTSMLHSWQSKDQRQRSAEAAAQLLSLKTSCDPKPYPTEVPDVRNFSPRASSVRLDELDSGGKRRHEEMDRFDKVFERPETRQRTSVHNQPIASSVPRFAGYNSAPVRTMNSGTPEQNPDNRVPGGPPRILPVDQALRQINQSLAPLQMIPAQIATLASQVASMQSVIDSINTELSELKSQTRNLSRRSHNSRAIEPYSPLMPLEREIPGPSSRAHGSDALPPGFPSCLSDLHELSHEELDRLEDYYGRHFGDPTMRDDAGLLKRRFIFLQYIRA